MLRHPKGNPGLPFIVAEGESLMTNLFVNGKAVQVDVDPSTPLLWVLRDELELKGTKFGCGMALCGACTVHLDGIPTRACITPIAAVGDRTVTTIEGVDQASEVARKVKAAWLTLDVIQ